MKIRGFRIDYFEEYKESSLKKHKNLSTFLSSPNIPSEQNEVSDYLKNFQVFVYPKKISQLPEFENWFFQSNQQKEKDPIQPHLYTQPNFNEFIIEKERTNHPFTKKGPQYMETLYFLNKEKNFSFVDFHFHSFFSNSSFIEPLPDFSVSPEQYKSLQCDPELHVINREYLKEESTHILSPSQFNNPCPYFEEPVILSQEFPEIPILQFVSPHFLPVENVTQISKAGGFESFSFQDEDSLLGFVAVPLQSSLPNEQSIILFNPHKSETPQFHILEAPEFLSNEFVSNSLCCFVEKELFSNLNAIPIDFNKEKSVFAEKNVVGVSNQHFVSIADYIWKRDDFLFDERIKVFPTPDISSSKQRNMKSILSIVEKDFSLLELASIELKLSPLWNNTSIESALTMLSPNPTLLPNVLSNAFSHPEMEGKLIFDHSKWMVEEDNMLNEPIEETLYLFSSWNSIFDNSGFSSQEIEKICKALQRSTINENNLPIDGGRGLILKYNARTESLPSIKDFENMVSMKEKRYKNKTASSSITSNPSSGNLSSTNHSASLNVKKLTNKPPSPSITEEINEYIKLRGKMPISNNITTNSNPLPVSSVNTFKIPSFFRNFSFQISLAQKVFSSNSIFSIPENLQGIGAGVLGLVIYNHLISSFQTNRVLFILQTYFDGTEFFKWIFQEKNWNMLENYEKNHDISQIKLVLLDFKNLSKILNQGKFFSNFSLVIFQHHFPNSIDSFLELNHFLKCQKIFSCQANLFLDKVTLQKFSQVGISNVVIPDPKAPEFLKDLAQNYSIWQSIPVSDSINELTSTLLVVGNKFLQFLKNQQIIASNVDFLHLSSQYLRDILFGQIRIAKTKKISENIEIIKNLIALITTRETYRRLTEGALSVAHDYFLKSCNSPKYKSVLSELYSLVHYIFALCREEMEAGIHSNHPKLDWIQKYLEERSSLKEIKFLIIADSLALAQLIENNILKHYKHIIKSSIISIAEEIPKLDELLLTQNCLIVANISLVWQIPLQRFSKIIEYNTKVWGLIQKLHPDQEHIILSGLESNEHIRNLESIYTIIDEKVGYSSANVEQSPLLQKNANVPMKLVIGERVYQDQMLIGYLQNEGFEFIFRTLKCSEDAIFDARNCLILYPLLTLSVENIEFMMEHLSRLVIRYERCFLVLENHETRALPEQILSLIHQLNLKFLTFQDQIVVRISFSREETVALILSFWNLITSSTSNHFQSQELEEMESEQERFLTSFIPCNPFCAQGILQVMTIEEFASNQEEVNVQKLWWLPSDNIRKLHQMFHQASFLSKRKIQASSVLQKRPFNQISSDPNKESTEKNTEITRRKNILSPNHSQDQTRKGEEEKEKMYNGSYDFFEEIRKK